MNKKKLEMILISIVMVISIIIVVVILSMNSKSYDIKFDSNYKAYVGIKVNSDIILVINNKNKIANILFLNKDAVDTLANQKIEGKDIDTAIELIVDKLKNKGEFNNGENLYLTSYVNNNIYSSILSNLNKNFVIYGIDNKLIEQTSNLSIKLDELNLRSENDELSNLKELYNCSKKLLKD